MANDTMTMPKKTRDAVKPQIISLRTQLVSEGHTRVLLSETENCTFRIHCYAPKGGENGLHTHIDEDHVFVVLQGEAQFYDLDGPLPLLTKNQALMLPRGAFYSFENSGDGPLILLRFGAMEKNWKGGRLDPDGKPLAGRAQTHHSKEPVLIEGKYSE